MRGLATVGRDNARLPVQWSSAPNAGFTSPDATPWIRVHDDYKSVNIAEQLTRSDSPLSFWKRMLAFRNEYRDLTILGDFEIHDIWEQQTFTFIKKLRGAGEKGASERELIVVCSFSDGEEPVDFPKRFKGRNVELVVSTLGEKAGQEKYLAPWEGRAYLVTG